MEEVTKQSRKANYKNSKIFILEPKTKHPEEDIFYSSTTQPIFNRLSQLKKDNLKKNTSYKWLFEKYGVDNIKIVLVEGFICNNKEELQAKEAKYIRENDCINKIITLNNQEPKEDKQEIKKKDEQDKKEIEEIKEQIKEIKEKDKIIKKRDKEYYAKNKETILKKRRDKRQEINKQEEKEEILLLKEKNNLL